MLDIRELMSNAGIQVLFVSFNNYPLRWNPSKGSLKEPGCRCQLSPNQTFFILNLLIYSFCDCLQTKRLY